MDIEKALLDAIEAERAAHERYLEGANNAPDADTRSLFQQLAQWEEQHERLLNDRLTAIRLMKGTSQT